MRREPVQWTMQQGSRIESGMTSLLRMRRFGAAARTRDGSHCLPWRCAHGENPAPAAMPHRRNRHRRTGYAAFV